MNRRRAINTLLFDWDGTIVDSAQIGLVAFEKAFGELGHAFPQEAYETTYSPNWYSMYAAMKLPKEQWARADELWMKHYGEQSAAFVEGAEYAIQNLQQKGYRLGVVSSGSDSRLEREIKHLGLVSAFEVVICNEHIINKKPHPEGLEMAMRSLKCACGEVGYVGDSPEDIEMGKSAGVFTVGVRSNYPTSWKVSKAEPDLYLESLRQLAEYF